ncbi:hypothetical protein [Paenibacillus sp. KS-LC4]|uniref:hypothetical protein n=1 Tax=Paenibacillus sp. KS-LC4 TaxID=2979727 RepID=UPI0030D12308
MAEEKLRDQLTKVMAQRRKQSGEGTVGTEEGQGQTTAQVLGASASEAGESAANAAGGEALDVAPRAKELEQPSPIQPLADQLMPQPEASSAEQPSEEWKAFYEAVRTYVSKMRD